MIALPGILLCVVVGAAPDAAASAARRAPVSRPVVHDFHVTYARMGVEGRVIQARLRFFQDDLEEALRRRIGANDVSLAADPQTDSLVTAYLAEHFQVRTPDPGTGVDDTALDGHIVASGEEIEGSERIWWYVMQYTSDREIRRVVVDSYVLLDLFDDQRNILRMQHFPSERQRTWYLTHGATRADFEIQ